MKPLGYLTERLQEDLGLASLQTEELRSLCSRLLARTSGGTVPREALWKAEDLAETALRLKEVLRALLE